MASTRLLFLLGCGLVAHGQQFDRGPSIALLEENDLVVRTDRHYTQGLKLSYLGTEGAPPSCLAGLSAALPSLGYEVKAERVGMAIGQSIFTPADTATSALLTNDRPYAGWLYVGLIWHRRGLVADRVLSMESFELNLGILGPPSLADQAQTWVHKVRGFDLPQGWDNQIHTEPGIVLKYQRSWILAPKHFQARLWDFAPHAGFSLGNVETSFRAGVTARIGLNLPDHFGSHTIHSLMTSDGGRSRSNVPRTWSISGFVGIEGQLVAHSAFLDGNLFRPSHSVPKETSVAEWKAGVLVQLGRLELGYTHVTLTREFTLQTDRDRYGALFCRYSF